MVSPASSRSRKTPWERCAPHSDLADGLKTPRLSPAFVIQGEYRRPAQSASDLACHVLRYRERMAEWYSPGYAPSPRRERPAEPLWTLERNSRQVTCQLCDHGEPAGAEVQLLKNGEFYAGRRFDTRDQALRHADHVRENLERDGWRVESPLPR
jgi:hypothetical protein